MLNLNTNLGTNYSVQNQQNKNNSLSSQYISFGMQFEPLFLKDAVTLDKEGSLILVKNLLYVNIQALKEELLNLVKQKSKNSEEIKTVKANLAEVSRRLQKLKREQKA